MRAVNTALLQQGDALKGLQSGYEGTSPQQKAFIAQSQEAEAAERGEEISTELLTSAHGKHAAAVKQTTQNYQSLSAVFGSISGNMEAAKGQLGALSGAFSFLTDDGLKAAISMQNYNGTLENGVIVQRALAEGGKDLSASHAAVAAQVDVSSVALTKFIADMDDATPKAETFTGTVDDSGASLDEWGKAATTADEDAAAFFAQMDAGIRILTGSEEKLPTLADGVKQVGTEAGNSAGSAQEIQRSDP